MKTVSKLLNALAAIFILIGIYATIMYFVKIRPQNDDYKLQLEKNAKLEYQQERNSKQVVTLNYKLHERDEIIKDRNSRIDEMANELDEANKREREAIEKLNNLSLEEVINYITGYYGIDESEVDIVKYDNEIRISFKESLVREVANTITKLESRNIELSVYKREVSEYELLVLDYKCKVNFLEQKDSLNVDNLGLEKEKNTGLQNIIDNGNKKIKSITTQRNVVGGIAITVLILGLI